MTDVKGAGLSYTTSEAQMIRILSAEPDSAARKALACYFGTNWARTPTRETGAYFVHKGTPPGELIATLMPVLRKDTYIDSMRRHPTLLNRQNRPYNI